MRAALFKGFLRGHRMELPVIGTGGKDFEELDRFFPEVV
jgi:hypothetical protein